jgi:hypothetical protein
MKQNIKKGTPYFIIILITYLSFAFITQELIPNLWDIHARGAFVIAVVVTCLIYGMIPKEL